MQGIRKLFRWLLVCSGLLIAIIVLVYLALVLINWRDDPASSAAQQMDRIHAERPAVAAPDNAYLYMLGITAAEGQDPIELGRQHVEWMRWASQQPWTEDLVEPEYPRWTSHDHELPLFVEPLIEACNTNNGQCTQRLESHEPRLAEWLKQEHLLLERYQELIKLPAMYEPLPYNIRFAFPEYQHALKGQRLYLVDIWKIARQGNLHQAQEMLDTDLRFWRMALASSDILISRLIANAAIRQHFLWSIQLFQDQDKYAGLLPTQAWREPATARERSWRRTLSGEAAFVDDYLQQMKAREINWLTEEEEDEDSLKQQAIKALGPPLLLRQTSMNRYADLLLELDEIFSAPYATMMDAKQRAEHLESSRKVTELSFSHLRNLGGFMLEMQASETGFTGYMLRVTDLEGLRRASVLLADMRNQRIAANHAAAYVQSSELRDPYREQPFGWDPKTSSLLFDGLSESNSYRLTY